MKIWGLTPSKFFSAIIAGLILAVVVITLISSSHVDKVKEAPNNIVQSGNLLNTTIININDNISSAFSLVNIIVIMCGILLVCMGLGIAFR